MSWNRREARYPEWQSRGIDRNSIPFALCGDDAGVFEKSKVFGALRSQLNRIHRVAVQLDDITTNSCGDRAGPEAPTTFM